MAAEIKETFEVESELLADGKGIFDVMVDDNLVYSKYQTGRFPEPNEVTRIIRSLESSQ